MWAKPLADNSKCLLPVDASRSKRLCQCSLIMSLRRTHSFGHSECKSQNPFRFSNIWTYSLLKQNIKSCNARRRWQRKRLKYQWVWLAKNNFARAAHFFCIFLYFCFARLHCETSLKHVLCGKYRMCSCSLFFFLLALLVFSPPR